MCHAASAKQTTTTGSIASSSLEPSYTEKLKIKTAHSFLLHFSFLLLLPSFPLLPLLLSFFYNFFFSKRLFFPLRSFLPTSFSRPRFLFGSFLRIFLLYLTLLDSSYSLGRTEHKFHCPVFPNDLFYSIKLLRLVLYFFPLRRSM